MWFQPRPTVAGHPLPDQHHDVGVEVEARGEDVVDAAVEDQLERPRTMQVGDLPGRGARRRGHAFGAVLVAEDASVGARHRDERPKAIKVGPRLAKVLQEGIGPRWTPDRDQSRGWET